MYNDIITGHTTISVVGLGYVGLPIAIAFAGKVKVIGFDISKSKIEQYKKGIDPTAEVGPEKLAESTAVFTSDPGDLKEARFHIVAVPTPVRDDNTPDLSILESACTLLGQNMAEGSIIVFESTVYPGVTEDICVPILEKTSGFKCGNHFHVGFSPERINPGDKEHKLENIIKIVSGMDEKTLDIIAKVYELVVEVGVYRAPSIKVAEAAKVIENAQRDINIAFMNELSLIFHRLNIDTIEVLKAAGTKWNFLNFRPGLVGGHCIGVDPYYLTYKAMQVGYNPQVILAGRRINDDMGRYVAVSTLRQLIRDGADVSKCKIVVMGLTFKENCPDIRNTRVIDILDELQGYGITALVHDYMADSEEAKEHYGITLIDSGEISDANCLIVAVAHKEFYDLKLSRYLKPGGLLVDVKGIYEPEKVTKAGYKYWRL